MLDKFFFYFHYLLILLNIIAPFVLPLGWIKPYILFLIIIIIHWYILKGKCIISLLHKKSSQNEGAISNCFKNLNITPNDTVLDILLYFLVSYSFYRIGCLKEGILVVIILVLLNKTIYNSYSFSWTEKRLVNINCLDTSGSANTAKINTLLRGGPAAAIGGGVGAGIGYVVFRGPVGAGVGAGVGALASSLISKTQKQ